MPTGNVKWFNPTKGYGFIRPQGGGRDVFVHISAMAAPECQRRQPVPFQAVATSGQIGFAILSVGAAAKADRSWSLSGPGATRIVRGSTLEAEMATGTVKWFNPTKGYGFIQPSGGGGRDVFVHISAVERSGCTSLSEGIKIRYELLTTRVGKTVAAAAFAHPV